MNPWPIAAALLVVGAIVLFWRRDDDDGQGGAGLVYVEDEPSVPMGFHSPQAAAC
jgi:hypothetical protein